MKVLKFNYLAFTLSPNKLLYFKYMLSLSFTEAAENSFLKIYIFVKIKLNYEMDKNDFGKRMCPIL
ncbi:MAG: hypothetical protein ACI86M_001228 [Saprospiraceae bacterium]|jgi:hypothetical protein